MINSNTVNANSKIVRYIVTYANGTMQATFSEKVINSLLDEGEIEFDKSVTRLNVETRYYNLVD